MKIADEEKVSLATMRNGAVIELVDAAIERVIANVMDPNTEPTAKRGVVLKLVITPTDDRENAGITATCEVKLAADRGVMSIITIGEDRDGRAQATELTTRQTRMALDDVDPETGEVANVTALRAKKGEVHHG